MSDVSDPEDEIVDIGPGPYVPSAAPGGHGHSHGGQACTGDHGPPPPQQTCDGNHGAHGHSHGPPRQQQRAPAKAPPGSDRWPAIYPIYINKNRTRQQGRRIAKEDTVENPTFWEIRDVLKDCGLQIWIENKVHPREPDRFHPLGPPPMGNPNRGRIKYKLYDDDGKPCNKMFQNKIEVYKYLGRMIPKLKQRIEGTKMVEQHILQLQEETEKEPEKAASKKPTAGSANKKSNKKPKAKKPRR